MGQRKIKKGTTQHAVHYEAPNGDKGIGFIGSRKEVFRELRESSATAKGYTFEVRKATPEDQKNYTAALGALREEAAQTEAP